MKSLIILALSMMASGAVSAATLKLPLRDGRYSYHACDSESAKEKDGTLGVYVLDDGSQFISPDSEGIDAFCTISRLKKSGDTFTGTARCERGGMKVKYPIGTYAFSYRVTSPTSFVTNDTTYQWCAAHR